MNKKLCMTIILSLFIVLTFPCVKVYAAGEIQNLVTWYYTSILDRDPEPGGAEYWTSEIERITSLGIDTREGFISLGKLFFTSQEYTSKNTTNSAYVNDLYEAFLHRPASQNEINTWKQELNSGLSRNMLLNYFIFCNEFNDYMTGMFGDTSAGAEYSLVNDLYRGFLSRMPDNDGFNSCVGPMSEAKCSGDEQGVRDLSRQYALNFLNSAEYAARGTSNLEYIEDLYNGILRRGANVSEVNSWIDGLNSGIYTRASLLNIFVDSQEFQGRVQDVINDNTNCDTTPPTVPQNLTAAADNCSQVSLSWGPSQDNPGGSGLNGYNLFRNGSYFDFVPAASGTSTTDTGVAESATYSYTAKAVDNAGNPSSESNIAVTNTPACPSGGGNTVWAKRFGGTDSETAYSLARDNTGKTIIAGVFQGTVDFGGGPVTSIGPNDLFIAKYSASGDLLWIKHFGGSASSAQARAVAVGSNDDIFITGYFRGTVNFGSGPVSSHEDYAGPTDDIFLLKLSSAGNYVWDKQFGNVNEDRGLGIAVDSDDNVVITGSFYYSVNFGNGWLESNGLNDIFLAKFSSHGVNLWGKTFGGANNDSGYAVAIDENYIDGNDDIVMTGYFTLTADFGGGPLTGTGFSNDIFLVKFTSSGAHKWSKGFSGSNSDRGYGLTISSNYDIFLTGSFMSEVNFGGGYITSIGFNDVFVTKFSSTGGYMWSRHCGTPFYNSTGYGIATSEDSVVVTGAFSGAIDCGDGPIINAGNDDILVSKYTTWGEHLWTKGFGSSNWDGGYGIAVDDITGDAYVTGHFEGTVNFGTGPLTSSGFEDIFLIKLAP